MCNQDFAVIIRKVAGGDEQALATLYDATSPLLFGVALRIVGDTATAEDVLCETYAQACCRAAEYDSEREAPLTWLVMLTRRLAIDRRRSYLQDRDAPEIFAPTENTSKSSDGEAARPTTESQKSGRAALASLAPEERSALELSFYAGLNCLEVASRLDIPVCEAKARMRSGMMKLHEQLKPVSENLPGRSLL
jgi:RNA polymerase sigma-70 factor, ECF subfamily